MAEGFIRQRGTAWQVIVHAGRDPLTGKRRNLTGMARTKREAQALRARLLTQVNEGKRLVATLMSAAIGRLGRISGRRQSAGHQHGHIVVPAVAPRTWQRTRRSAPGTTANRPRPRPSRVNMVAVRSAWPPRPPRGEPERTCRGHGRTLPLRPSATPSRFRTLRTPPVALPRPRSAGGCSGYGNWSPGWRPLVRCSQRR
jgi:hypothetical protein